MVRQPRGLFPIRPGERCGRRNLPPQRVSKLNKTLRSISSYIRRLHNRFLSQDRARLDGQQGALSD